MMKVVEIKQELNDTSFEQEIFDISKLSRHIVSMLDIAETSVPTLSKYDFKHKRYIMNIRRYSNNRLDSLEKLKQDKIEFIRNGNLEKI